jgi:tetratricopeptide (TPR) repeat protein
MQLRLGWIFLALCILLIISNSCYFESTTKTNGIVQQQDIINNHTEALQKLKDDKEHTVNWFYKMHELYYNGIPDKYDESGNKIKGIAPNYGKAISYLQQAATVGHNPQMWLKLAGIHHNGMYNYKPELDKASAIYKNIINVFPYQNIVVEAREQLDKVQQEIKKINTYSWLNLKYTPKSNQHHDQIAKMLQTGTGTGTGIGTGHGHGTGTGTGTGGLMANRLFRSNLTTTIPVPANGFGDLLRDNDPSVIMDPNDRRHNDAHNTHNSQVVATVANSLKKLQESTDIKKTTNESLREIREYVNNQPNCDRRTDALKSLDSMERNIIPVTSVSMKEVDALNIVWNRINNNYNDNNDLKDILYTQLADMQEYGKSVCSTGRLERIVDTLSTFDQNVSIKPTYVINDEMMNKASKIRNDVYTDYGKQYGESRHNMLQEGLAPDQTYYDTKVKETIVDTLYKDYVDTGILTQEKFQSQIDGWIDEI